MQLAIVEPLGPPPHEPEKALAAAETLPKVASAGEAGAARQEQQLPEGVPASENTAQEGSGQRDLFASGASSAPAGGEAPTSSADPTPSAGLKVSIPQPGGQCVAVRMSRLWAVRMPACEAADGISCLSDARVVGSARARERCTSKCACKPAALQQPQRGTTLVPNAQAHQGRRRRCGGHVSRGRE